MIPLLFLGGLLAFAQGFFAGLLYLYIVAAGVVIYSAHTD